MLVLELYQPIQKYKFESKSQLRWGCPWPIASCINQYKNTNLKANHNIRFWEKMCFQAVSTNTKIQIWKQITTASFLELIPCKLYQPIQKYKFESKSQLIQIVLFRQTSCINQYKNTNLKANHNGLRAVPAGLPAVSTNTKIQIWKQITTAGLSVCFCLVLYQPIQKYKFESKSQPLTSSYRHWNSCINQYKNTNLKANHNDKLARIFDGRAVSTNTKIQIWKQITTIKELWNGWLMLYQPIQKYKFESKSQRDNIPTYEIECCINQYKNTNLSFDKMGCVLAMAKKSASCFFAIALDLHYLCSAVAVAAA